MSGAADVADTGGNARWESLDPGTRILVLEVRRIILMFLNVWSRHYGLPGFKVEKSGSSRGV